MCGIAGIVGLKDRDLASSSIRQMAQSIEHRGPDAEGFFITEEVAFAHRRLSIIDLSPSANQPLFDSTNRYSIILNGEIYNYQEVKNELPDYPFVTESDTEVVVAAYAKYGPDCLSLLNGMFAVAIWDSLNRELFVARDRLGVKPFYYSQTPNGVFVFASEIRSILSSGLVPRKLNKSAVYDYLLYQSVYSPQTIVENVMQLPAGEFGIFSNSKLETKPYWRIEANKFDEDFDDEDAVRAKIKDLLLKSVERRMISDVRLGAFLSGGIDSSAVVGLMSEVSSQPVDSFSVTFTEKKFDESHFSNLVAKRFNTRHTSVCLTPSDFLAELPNALGAVDSPSGDGINTYIVSKATKKSGITVALSGLGGDELFAGYPNFVRWTKTQNGALGKIPWTLRKPLSSVLSFSQSSKSQRLGQLVGADKLTLANIYPLLRQVMSQQAASHLTANGGHNGNHKLRIRSVLNDKASSIAKFPLLSQFSIAEMLGYTLDVLLKDTDQFSMASALEVREPFFDYKLVEYVLQVPDRLKFPTYPKKLLVEAISPLLPDEVVHRPKMGFALPWAKWMRNELKEFCDSRIDALADMSIVEPDELRSRWKAFQNGSNGFKWSEFWHVIVLAEWLEHNEF